MPILQTGAISECPGTQFKANFFAPRGRGSRPHGTRVLYRCLPLPQTDGQRHGRRLYPRSSPRSVTRPPPRSSRPSFCPWHLKSSRFPRGPRPLRVDPLPARQFALKEICQTGIDQALQLGGPQEESSYLHCASLLLNPYGCKPTGAPSFSAEPAKVSNPGKRRSWRSTSLIVQRPRNGDADARPSPKNS